MEPITESRGGLSEADHELVRYAWQILALGTHPPILCLITGKLDLDESKLRIEGENEENHANYWERHLDCDFMLDLKLYSQLTDVFRRRSLMSSKQSLFPIAGYNSKGILEVSPNSDSSDNSNFFVFVNSEDLLVRRDVDFYNSLRRDYEAIVREHPEEFCTLDQKGRVYK